jgi:adenosylhomocysteinase
MILMSKVKDIKLADDGRMKIEWAENHMPVLMKIREEFAKEKPLKGLTIAACLHVTKETAVLMRTLRDGGANVGLCGSNPLSTQDDIAAALAEEGINVFAWRGVNNDEYYWCLNQILDMKPNITMDDGGDLVAEIHSKRTDLLKNIIGGTEETTTGVIRFRSMEKDKALKYPVIAVNDAYTKHLFDNYYGTGQSTIDGIVRASSVLLAGKNFVVGGYGWCGRGIATRARGMGCKVIVTEVDPVKALQAYMDGFQVMSMSEASRIGDIFVTASGDKDLIRKEHFQSMKPGAMLANSGHFNVEINIKDLESLSSGKRTVKPNVEEFKLKSGKKLYLLGEGRLVNLAAAEGHPPEVMQMSFANQALCSKYVKDSKGKLQPKVYGVPKEIDSRVATLALQSAGIQIDSLTPEQKKYLESWQEGT